MCSFFFANPGGLAVREGARAVLMESTIADCASVSGGGVGAFRHANVTLQGGSRIERCNATGFGGGIVLYYGSHVELLDSVLSECLADRNGGLDVWEGGHLLATNSVRGVDRSNTRAPRGASTPSAHA